MILYLDTSALVKLYAQEPGAGDVHAAIGDAEIVATVTIAYAEARAALARKRRLGEMTEDVLREKRRELDRDWARLARIAVTEELVRRAGDLAEAHGLRAYDSVHLAAADLLRSTAPPPFRFLCFDRRLDAAALALGW